MSFSAAPSEGPEISTEHMGDPRSTAMSQMKRTALLGHTGFVGSILSSTHSFDAYYNSSNIEKLRGESFDLVVCSAVSALKWQVNKNPETDWAKIQKLLEVLSTIRANRFVLISTIDVYPRPIAVDENLDLSSLPNHAYGFHRLQVEQFVRDVFSTCHIIRLPGVFGSGLKKNVIFDLLHANQVEKIHPGGVFQYYPLHALWEDICRMVDRGIQLLNLATEPIATRTIVERFFANQVLQPQGSPAPKYDFRSRFAPLWGGFDGYLYTADHVLAHLARFVAEEQIRLR